MSPGIKDDAPARERRAPPRLLPSRRPLARRADRLRPALCQARIVARPSGVPACRQVLNVARSGAHASRSTRSRRCSNHVSASGSNFGAPASVSRVHRVVARPSGRTLRVADHERRTLAGQAMMLRHGPASRDHSHAPIVARRQAGRRRSARRARGRRLGSRRGGARRSRAGAKSAKHSTCPRGQIYHRSPCAEHVRWGGTRRRRDPSSGGPRPVADRLLAPRSPDSTSPRLDGPQTRRPPGSTSSRLQNRPDMLRPAKPGASVGTTPACVSRPAARRLRPTTSRATPAPTSSGAMTAPAIVIVLLVLPAS